MDVKGFEDTIKWYDSNAEKYAEASEQLSSPEQLEEFINLLPEKPSVLDAGCSAGRDTTLLHEAGAKVTGVDLSVGLIKEAKKRHPNLNFIHGNFLNLPFNNASFDGVWAHASLLHLETVDDVKKALLEFNRVLKPNGVLHIFVKAQNNNEKTAVVSDSLSGHDRFFQYFTKSEIQDLLTKQGFINIETRMDKDKHNRPGVEWILSLSRKVN